MVNNIIDSLLDMSTVSLTTCHCVVLDVALFNPQRPK